MKKIGAMLALWFFALEAALICLVSAVMNFPAEVTGVLLAFILTSSLIFVIPYILKLFNPEVIYKGSENFLQECFSKGSRSSLLFADGYRLWDKGEYAAALNIFEEVLRCPLNKRERAALNFFMGHCYEMTDYPKKSAEHYEKALSFGMRSDELIRRLIRMSVTCGNFERAKALFTYLDSPEVYKELRESLNWNYAMYYMAKGDTINALDYLEKEPDGADSARIKRLLWSKIYALISLNRANEASAVAGQTY